MRRRLDSLTEKPDSSDALQARRQRATRAAPACRLVDFRAAEQVALEIVDAPFAQQPPRFLVLDPFGDGLDAEMARELRRGVRTKKRSSSERATFCTKAPSILTMSTPRRAQVAERGVSGAEIVHRDLRRPSAFIAASTPHALVDRFDRQRLDDLDDQPLGGARAGRERRFQPIEPVGERRVATEILTETRKSGSAARRSSASSSTR